MTRSVPIGSIADPSRAIAVAVRRRICSTDGPVLVWTDDGEVFAQACITRMAQHAEQHKADGIVGIYTKGARVGDIEGDVREMQKEVAA